MARAPAKGAPRRRSRHLGRPGPRVHPGGRQTPPSPVDIHTVRRPHRNARARVRRRHIEEGWPPDQIARQHRVSERAVRGAIQGVPLPPIRFHDLRHGAATLALLGKVDMKVISETLGHSRHSFTADTYTSVLPEVSRAAAEAVAAVVPRMSVDDATDEQATFGAAERDLADGRRRSRTEHAG
ncbi:tyrosine-type recombinase/integrase [Actinomadura latina]|uniref:Tyrosine-type recombinase/integrase n=1 Tax=Actinomadura latina TaxID=163603 RepID=A0A846ZEQ2_9ACTN|nr:tyrosine-type recombinase/integrase [Actinomadura latina]NKZ09095.1 tyrosine-type recombinase/integrase [Actinomadura latina]